MTSMRFVAEKKYTWSELKVKSEQAHTHTKPLFQNPGGVKQQIAQGVLNDTKDKILVQQPLLAA